MNSQIQPEGTQDSLFKRADKELDHSKHNVKTESQFRYSKKDLGDFQLLILGRKES